MQGVLRVSERACRFLRAKYARRIDCVNVGSADAFTFYAVQPCPGSGSQSVRSLARIDVRASLGQEKGISAGRDVPISREYK